MQPRYGVRLPDQGPRSNKAGGGTDRPERCRGVVAPPSVLVGAATVESVAERRWWRHVTGCGRGDAQRASSVSRHGAARRDTVSASGSRLGLWLTVTTLAVVTGLLTATVLGWSTPLGALAGAGAVVVSIVSIDALVRARRTDRLRRRASDQAAARSTTYHAYVPPPPPGAPAAGAGAGAGAASNPQVPVATASVTTPATAVHAGGGDHYRAVGPAGHQPSPHAAGGEIVRAGTRARVADDPPSVARAAAARPAARAQPASGGWRSRAVRLRVRGVPLEPRRRSMARFGFAALCLTLDRGPLATRRAGALARDHRRRAQVGSLENGIRGDPPEPRSAEADGDPTAGARW